MLNPERSYRKMDDKTIAEVASTFGLDIEVASGLPGERKSFRIYKGANQVFAGTEEAARSFLVRYERERPGLFAESMYSYKE